MSTYGIILIILVILIIAVLAMIALAWFFRPSAKPVSAKTEVKTQPIVQRFVSNDLKKRAFVIRLNEGGFKVVYQRYSNEVINRGGEVAGWQDLPEKPIVDSFPKAVELAQSWVHAED
jgi:Na+-transporting methylmalonyl-CoA/oxaloacetate decarboxylase gamma subunit